MLFVDKWSREEAVHQAWDSLPITAFLSFKFSSPVIFLLSDYFPEKVVFWFFWKFYTVCLKNYAHSDLKIWHKKIFVLKILALKNQRKLSIMTVINPDFIKWYKFQKPAVKTFQYWKLAAVSPIIWEPVSIKHGFW